MTEIEKLKIQIKDDSITDDELQLMLDDATQEVLDYTNRDELLDSMKPLVRKIVVYNYNLSQFDGEKSRSEGGVSVTYDTEIPKDITQRLVAYRLNKAVLRTKKASGR